MVNNKDNSDLKWFWWRWVITGLTILALVLSGILSWHYLKGGTLAGCGGGSPCDQVLNSRWSLLAGIVPVSGLAMGAYLAMLFAGFFIGPYSELSVKRLAWKIMLFLAGSIVGSAIWFTVVQKWIIGSFCLYCMTTHITGFLLAIFIIWRAIIKREKQAIRPLAAIGLVLGGIVVAGIMAFGQVSFTPSSVYSNGESQDNPTTIDLENTPIIGYPEAPYIVNVLFDYQCPHCQQLHLLLDDAVGRYDGKLAFILCPTPLNPECNPYIPRIVDEYKNSCELARIGLAVWIASREAFPDFENWMFTFESGSRWRPRSPEAAREKAIELVGKAEYDEASVNPWIDQYLQTSTQIYEQTIQSGNGGVPKLVYNSNWIIPEPYGTDDLISILQKSFNIPSP